MDNIIINWVDSGSKLEELGFERIPDSPHYRYPEDSSLGSILLSGLFSDHCKLAKFLYEAGLNVMMYHDSDGKDCIAVDTKRFSCR